MIGLDLIMYLYELNSKSRSFKTHCLLTLSFYVDFLLVTSAEKTLGIFTRVLLHHRVSSPVSPLPSTCVCHNRAGHISM